MSRRTRIVVPVAVFVVAAVVAAVVVFTRDDPRPAFATTAGELCAAAAAEFGELDPPASSDLAARLELYERFAAVNEELAKSIDALDAPGAAAELRDELVAITRTRVAVFDESALAGLVEDEAAFVEAVDRFSEVQIASYRDAGTLLGRWDADTPCATVPTAGSGAVDAALSYTSELSTLCGELTETLVRRDEDAAAGELDRDEYLDAVATAITAARADAEGVTAHPVTRVVEAFGGWLGVLDDAAAAAADGDGVRIAELNLAWAAAADAMEVPDCSDGVVASASNPSGYLAAPALPTGSGPTGVELGEVPLGGWTLEMLLARAGADPEVNFGLELAAFGLYDGSAAMPGDQPATGGGISISTARPVDPDTEPSASNVWLVGVAMEADGGCVWGRLWGHPKLTGFSSSPAAGPCTGDAALAAAVEDAAVNPPG